MIENGCRLHNDCFTCPFADCEAPTIDIARGFRAAVSLGTKTKSARKSKRRKRKEELQKEFPFLDF